MRSFFLMNFLQLPIQFTWSNGLAERVSSGSRWDSKKQSDCSPWLKHLWMRWCPLQAESPILSSAQVDWWMPPARRGARESLPGSQFQPGKGQSSGEWLQNRKPLDSTRVRRAGTNWSGQRNAIRTPRSAGGRKSARRIEDEFSVGKGSPLFWASDLPNCLFSCPPIHPFCSADKMYSSSGRPPANSFIYFFSKFIQNW